MVDIEDDCPIEEEIVEEETVFDKGKDVFPVNALYGDNDFVVMSFVEFGVVNVVVEADSDVAVDIDDFAVSGCVVGFDNAFTFVDCDVGFLLATVSVEIFRVVFLMDDSDESDVDDVCDSVASGFEVFSSVDLGLFNDVAEDVAFVEGFAVAETDSDVSDDIDGFAVDTCVVVFDERLDCDVGFLLATAGIDIFAFVFVIDDFDETDVDDDDVCNINGVGVIEVNLTVVDGNNDDGRSDCDVGSIAVVDSVDVLEAVLLGVIFCVVERFVELAFVDDFFVVFVCLILGVDFIVTASVEYPSTDVDDGDIGSVIVVFNNVVDDSIDRSVDSVVVSSFV